MRAEHSLYIIPQAAATKDKESMGPAASLVERRKQRVWITLLFLLFFLCAGSYALGQAGQSAPTQADIPTETLRFGDPFETSIGGIRENYLSMLSRPACSPSGEMIVMANDNGEPTALWGISQGVDAPEMHSYPMNPPQNYIDHDFMGGTNMFVREDSIAVWARGTLRQTEADKKVNSWTDMVDILDRKGSQTQAIAIPRRIDMRTFGIYGSGNVLVVASEKETKSAHLYVFDPSGDVKRELRLFDQDFNLTPDHDKQQPGASFSYAGALTMMQVVAAGENLLLVPVGTSQPIVEVNEFGIVRATQLKLPKNQFLNSVVSVSPRSLTVLVGSPQIFKDSDGQPAGIGFPPNSLYEFDRFEGTISRKLDIPKEIKANSIACEHNGSFSVFDRNHKNGHVVVRYSLPSR